MERDEKIKRAAWCISRRALESGEWALVQDPRRAADVVEYANILVTSLEDGGCLDDKFGEGGSLEVDIAPGYIAKNAGSLSFATHGPAPMPSAPLAWYRERIFALVRDLDAKGLLTPEDRRRARVFEADAEAAREAKRQAEAAEKEKEREAQRQAEREEQRRELQLLKDELKAQREAVERARAEREAARQDENAEDEN